MMYIYTRAMQALYVPQEAQRQYFNFYFTGTSRDSYKIQCWNCKTKARDLCYKHQGSQQQKNPNPKYFKLFSPATAA